VNKPDNNNNTTTLNLCLYLLRFSNLTSLTTPTNCLKPKQLMSCDARSSFIFWSDCFLLPPVLPPVQVDWKPAEVQFFFWPIWCSPWASHTKSNIKKQRSWDYSILRNIKQYPPLSSAEDFQTSSSVKPERTSVSVTCQGRLRGRGLAGTYALGDFWPRALCSPPTKSSSWKWKWSEWKSLHQLHQERN